MKDELIQTFLDATSDKITSKCFLISSVTLVGLVSKNTFYSITRAMTKTDKVLTCFSQQMYANFNVSMTKSYFD